jgi:hypothetical protein
MGQVQPNGDKYYKMDIVSIHRGKDGETVWILGTWYYAPLDLEKLKIDNR